MRARDDALPLLLMAAVVGLAALLPPIAQPQDYHQFADQRSLGGLPNAWNVLTNLPFLSIGALGLAAVPRLHARACTTAAERRAVRAVFGALAAVGVGSSYYHLAPDDHRLFWDRLPLAALLMALTGVVAAERLRGGGRLLVPLVGLGVASTMWWRATGDLRLYVVLQTGAIAAVLALLGLRPARYSRGGDLLALVLLYAAAKAAEGLDAAILGWTAGAVGGHALKHLLAAAAMALFLAHLRRRRALEPALG